MRVRALFERVEVADGVVVPAIGEVLLRNRHRHDVVRLGKALDLGNPGRHDPFVDHRDRTGGA